MVVRKETVREERGEERKESAGEETRGGQGLKGKIGKRLGTGR